MNAQRDRTADASTKRVFRAAAGAHRSLSRRGFHLLLGSLGTLSLTVGTIFWLAGACR